MAPIQLVTDSPRAVTFEEFKEGSKKDPTIVQVRPPFLPSSLYPPTHTSCRLSHSTTDSSDPLLPLMLYNTPSLPLFISTPGRLLCDSEPSFTAIQVDLSLLRQVRRG
jgi:hypothetical protein